jgi:hypothetical protein
MEKEEIREFLKVLVDIEKREEICKNSSNRHLSLEQYHLVDQNEAFIKGLEFAKTLLVMTLWTKFDVDVDSEMENSLKEKK